MTDIEHDLVYDIIDVNGQAQLFVTHDKIVDVEKIVKFYGNCDVPIKLFVDVFANGKEKQEIEASILKVIENNPDFTIKTRFVGVQENRGKLCEGCEKKCITLKALWVFPNGTVSPCPQGVIEPKEFTEDIIESTFKGHFKSI